MSKNEWFQTCRHELSADVTDQMKEWLRAFGVDDREDRIYYLQIYTDGMAQLCDSTDGSGGIVFDLPDFKHCPLCGAKYPEQQST